MKNKYQKETRILTVQSDVRYGMKYLFKQVPRLKLSGLWLEKAEFKPGEKVKVEVKQQELIIKKAR